MPTVDSRHITCIFQHIFLSGIIVKGKRKALIENLMFLYHFYFVMCGFFLLQKSETASTTIPLSWTTLEMWTRNCSVGQGQSRSSRSTKGWHLSFNVGRKSKLQLDHCFKEWIIYYNIWLIEVSTKRTENCVNTRRPLLQKFSFLFEVDTSFNRKKISVFF